MRKCLPRHLQLTNTKSTNNHQSLSPDNSDAPPFLNSVIKKTLHDMKKNKASGNDNLTSDIICFGWGRANITN